MNMCVPVCTNSGALNFQSFKTYLNFNPSQLLTQNKLTRIFDTTSCYQVNYMNSLPQSYMKQAVQLMYPLVHTLQVHHHL